MKFLSKTVDMYSGMMLTKGLSKARSEEDFRKAARKLEGYAGRMREKSAAEEMRAGKGSGAGAHWQGLALLADAVGAYQKALAYPAGESMKCALIGMETAKLAKEKRDDFEKSMVSVLFDLAKDVGYRAAATGFANEGDFEAAEGAILSLSESKRGSRRGAPRREDPPAAEFQRIHLAWRRGDIAERIEELIERVGEERSFGAKGLLGSKRMREFWNLRRGSSEVERFRKDFEQGKERALQRAKEKALARAGRPVSDHLEALMQKERLEDAAGPAIGKRQAKGL